MRRVDHRIEIVDPKHTQIGNGKTAALVFMGGKFAVTGAGGEVFHFGREGRERFHLGVFQDRREQAAFDGNRNSHIGWFQFESTITSPDRIGLGHLLQGQSAGLDDEIVDRQFDAARFKLFVQIGAEAHQRIQLDIAAQIEMRDALFGFGQTCSDGFAHTVEFDLFEVSAFVDLQNGICGWALCGGGRCSGCRCGCSSRFGCGCVGCREPFDVSLDDTAVGAAAGNISKIQPFVCGDAPGER